MSTVIMEVNTEGFRNVSTQRHENIENGIPSPPTSLVFLHAAKETQTRARPATPKSQSSGVAPAAGHLDASATKQNGKVAVAIKQSKRERLMRWTWASTLNLVACEDATFEEGHWRKLKDFMDFWDRNNNTTWFRGLPSRNLAATLVSLVAKSGASGEHTPYICIQGLRNEKEIATFHAILSQKPIRAQYKPLRICFDRSLISVTSSNEEFYTEVDPSDWSLCGKLIRVNEDGQRTYCTIGGVLEINRGLHIITSSHPIDWGESTSDQSVSSPSSPQSTIPSTSPDTIEDLSDTDIEPALIVDEWRTPRDVSNLQLAPQSSPRPRRKLTEFALKLGMPHLCGVGWCLFPLEQVQFLLPNAMEDQNGILSRRVYFTNLEINVTRKEVNILGGRSGVCVGILSQNPSFLKLSTEVWTRVYTVRLLSGTSLLRGDSGSWVVDKIQRTVVGHVVAIANDLVYVTPLSQTIDEIKLAYPHHYVQLPSPFQLLADLAKYHQSKSDEESKVLAKEFASEAISLVLRGLDNLNATAVFLSANVKSGTDAKLTIDLLLAYGSNVACIWESSSPPASPFYHHGMDEFLNRLRAAARGQLQTSHAQDSDTIEVTEYIPENGERRDESLEYDTPPKTIRFKRCKEEDQANKPSSNIVEWESANDPANPRNWDSSKKWSNIIITHLSAFLALSALSMFAVGAPNAAFDFNSNSESLATFVVSIYVVGCATGSVTISLFSQRYGRLPVFHLSNLFFIGFSVACARSTSLVVLIIFRYLQGLAGSGPVCISSGILADLLPMKGYFKYYLVLITLSFADSVGPIAGAFLVSAKGWRWIFWLLAIAFGIISCAALALCRETFEPVLLERKAHRLRKETGNADLQSKYYRSLSFYRITHLSFDPLGSMLLHSPISAIFSIYTSVVYSTYLILLTTFPYVFGRNYGFSTDIIGLSYVAVLVGTLLAIAIPGIWVLTTSLIHHSQRAHMKSKSHRRLLSILPTLITLPTGIIIYGWAAEYKVQWAVAMLGIVLVGYSFGGWVNFINLYLDDIYPTCHVTARRLNFLIRSLSAGIAPLAGLKVYKSLGLGWGNSLLAFMTLAAGGVPIALNFLGKPLTKRDRFAQETPRIPEAEESNQNTPAASSNTAGIVE